MYMTISRKNILSQKGIFSNFNPHNPKEGKRLKIKANVFFKSSYISFPNPKMYDTMQVFKITVSCCT